MMLFPDIVCALRAHTTLTTQYDLISLIFNAYTTHYDTALDSGAVSRWCRGLANASPTILEYYRLNDGTQLMAQDIQRQVLPRMSDPWGAVTALQTIVDQSDISSHLRQELAELLDQGDIPAYIASIVMYALACQHCRR